MKFKVLYILLLVALTSCFEDDEMVAPHDPGNLTTGQVDISGTYLYENQVFFDFESNSSVSSNLLSEWDLGFETADSGWHVILNSSKMMLAGNSGQTDFESVNSKLGIEMNFDPSYGNLDSSAIGDWYSLEDEVPVSNNKVYIIDRGTDQAGNTVKDKKVTFGLKNENTYELRFANLDGSEEQSLTIPKDSSVNFVCVSFDNGIVNIEPPKNSWDLLFTKYSTLLFTDTGDPYPYLVTGVLLNPFNTVATLDTMHQFDEIDFDIAENLDYTNQKDTIGWDWKEYDFDNGRYTVLPEKVYIIKTSTGYYYKLRFIDYYNSVGEQGYPVFEFLRL